MKKILFFIGFMFISHLSFGQLVQEGSDIDGEGFFDSSGWSVSVNNDGSIVAVGAPFNANNGFDAGHVRIYNFDGVSWIQQGADIDGAEGGEQSGYAISLNADGNILAVGAPLNDDNGAGAGQVRIYNYVGGNWIQQGGVIGGEAGGVQSGSSVSLSNDGSRVAIGSPYNATNGVDAGLVRIFEYDGADWIQLGIGVYGPGAGDLYGNAISLSGDGNRVAVGAPANAVNGSNSGRVRIYEYDGAGWMQFGNDIEGDGVDSYLGRTVSLSSDGTRVAVGGAPNSLGEGGGPTFGYVRIYEYSVGSWGQLGSDITGEMLGDRFGISLSLSDDGNTVAAGATHNGGSGSNSGHVRAHGYDGANWVLLGEADGEDADDQSGFAIDLSGDGTAVVVGAPFNDDANIDAGHARVFSVTVLSVEDNEFSASLQLYPNPNNSVATITLPHPDSNMAVKIYDVQGRIVYQNQYGATDTIILDTASLTKGLYFVSLTAEGKRGVLRMVVN